MTSDLYDTSGPKLKDIAEAAGVSVASVSKVLNNRGGVGSEVRQRVLTAAERIGYQSRSFRNLQRAGVESTAFIVPTRYYSRSQFYEEVISGALDEAVSNSLKIDVRLVALDDHRIKEEVDTIIRDLQPGALIMLGIDSPTAIDRVSESGLPAVIINGMDRSMRVDCVLPDNWSAGWLATRNLLLAGHREIVHVTHPQRLSMQRRLDGFRVALEEAGVSFNREQHVFELPASGWNELEAHAGFKTAINSGRFANTTAFFCGTDLIAVGAMQALSDMGYSIPGDYSVIGFDDITIARHSRPPLTTVRIDRAELGRAGVKLLMQRISDPDATIQRVNLGVKMIERETVTAPRSEDKAIVEYPSSCP